MKTYVDEGTVDLKYVTVVLMFVSDVSLFSFRSFWLIPKVIWQETFYFCTVLMYLEETGNKVLDWVSTFSSLIHQAFFTETVWSQRTTFKMDAMVCRTCNQRVPRYLEHYFMTRVFCSVLKSFCFIILKKNLVCTKVARVMPSLMLPSLTTSV